MERAEIRNNVFCEQFSQVERFVKYLTYHRSILRKKLTDNSAFWTEACNVFLGGATLAWWNVFGDGKSDLHWTKLLKTNMGESDKKDFQNRIFQVTGLDEQRYIQYQNEIKDLRNKYIAHLDLDWKSHIEIVPSFDNALMIAKEYEKWIKYLLYNGGSVYSLLSFDRVIEKAENEVNDVAATVLSEKNNDTIGKD